MRSHEESRKGVCAVCLSKGAYPVTKSKEKLIQRFVFSNYSCSNTSYPLGLCGQHHIALSEYGRNIFKRSLECTIKYDELQIPSNTRSMKGVCTCTICSVAHLKPTSDKYKKQIMSNKNSRGRPRLKKKPNKITMCSDCLTQIGKGKPHKCHIKHLENNLISEANKAPFLVKDRVVTKLIKDKMFNENIKPGNSFQMSTRGKPIEIKLTSQKIETRYRLKQFSFKDFIRLQRSNNFSDRQIISIANSQRVVYGRKSVEMGLKDKMIERNNVLNNLFHFEKKSFEKYKSKQSKIVETEILERNIIKVKCLPEFINYVAQHRSISLVSDQLIKLGIDGGGGFFKICLSLIDTNHRSSTIHKRAIYAQGVAPLNALDTSVKRIFILAIVQEMQETYNNVKTILSLLQIENLDFLIASDLKLVNIILGLQAHSCKHPCCWCESERGKWEDAPLRTFGNLKKNYNDWVDSGSVPKMAMKYKNVVNTSLLTGQDSEQIIDRIPPMELHLFTGPINHIFKSLGKQWGEEKVIEFAKSVNAVRASYHGGEWEGNPCRILLNNSDKLERQFLDEGRIDLAPYISTLRSFQSMVSACYSINLNEDYIEKIDAFNNAYMVLHELHKITITTKIHTVVTHVKQFCKEKNRGLGIYSEQASESVHYDFGKTWDKFKVNLEHPEHGQRLLKAVCIYNSKHLD